MGIRIHKALGYGGTHPNRQELYDRVWEKAVKGEVMSLLDAEADRRKGNISPDTSDLLMNTTQGIDGCGIKLPEYFHDVLHYAEHPDEESGPFILSPPAFHESWYRFDDMMDYAACLGREDMCQTEHNWIEQPLYPYLHWMDKDTGESSSQYGMRAKQNPQLIPAVPLPVRLIADHLGFDWKTLRPLLATWWC